MRGLETVAVLPFIAAAMAGRLSRWAVQHASAKADQRLAGGGQSRPLAKFLRELDDDGGADLVALFFCNVACLAEGAKAPVSWSSR